MTAAGIAPVASTGLPGPETAVLRYRPESARSARRLVRAKLREWQLPHLVDAAELIVTELVSNALKTGCTTLMQVGVRHRADGTVRIQVRDGSRELPVVVEAGPDDESHRGLTLVRCLSAAWGADRDPYGKTVYADLRP
ncbi:ATP-binding protein [Kitasatospora sp. NPDC059646]|uniref:ATP-binding protein n=1 Tax=Kitasatospora sp. NPDC059646 TaxID=3346893 RepID=UPI0036AA3C17